MGGSTNSDIDGGNGGGRAKVWLEPRQVEELRNACFDESVASYLRQRNDAVIALMYDSGLRVGELVQVDVEMLRDNSGSLFVPTRIQKDYPTDESPPPVTIDLSSETARVLNSFLASRWKDTVALFPSRKSERLSTQGVRYLLERVAEIAGVRPFLVDGSRGDPSDVTPHALRHSVAYRMLHEEDGFSLYDVRSRLRHSTIVTTERVYDHFRRV